MQQKITKTRTSSMSGTLRHVVCDLSILQQFSKIQKENYSFIYCEVRGVPEVSEQVGGRAELLDPMYYTVGLGRKGLIHLIHGPEWDPITTVPRNLVP